jgi:hypothetical protein
MPFCFGTCQVVDWGQQRVEQDKLARERAEFERQRADFERERQRAAEYERQRFELEKQKQDRLARERAAEYERQQRLEQKRLAQQRAKKSYRYSDNGDGTVTDNRSGLIWMKNANCFGRQNWKTAMQSAANLADGQCGLSDDSRRGDWRLPTIYEWMAMVDDRYDFPALSNAAGTGQWKEGEAFTGVPTNRNWYWSSTKADTSSAWYVNLRYGGVDDGDQTGTGAVWAVRGGQ